MRYLPLALAFSLMATFSGIVHGAITIYSGTNPDNGILHDLVFSDSSLTWNEAESFATSNFGGHLASIHSLEENDFILNMIQTFNVSSSDTWIGLNDVGVNDWNWASGELLDYTNWNIGEPNNSSDFVVMKASNGKWNDSPSPEHNWFMVQTQPTPETADFDEDGDVDGYDFLKWQRAETPEMGSAEELALWESQYGTAVPLVAAAKVVPEPSTLLLASLAGLLFCSRRR